MEIIITVEDPKAEPTRAHEGDAGFDLRSNMPDFTLDPGQKVQVRTGLRMAIPVGYMGLVLPRSGLGTKYDIALANTVGVIDAGYRGEILVFLTNKGSEAVTIAKYDRFAQLIIVPVFKGVLTAVEKLPESARGSFGFGSTGVQ